VTFGPAGCRPGGGTIDGMEVDRNGLEVLGRDECLALLAGAVIGRIGLSSGALPTVLPVAYGVVGDRIVVRTGRGSKLDAATRNAVVAFEVDDIDPQHRTGWSVVVTGVARAIEPADLPPAQRGGPARWVSGGDDDRLVAISTELISGRRLRPGPVPRVGCLPGGVAS
jgi:hypothetical protein